MDPVNFAVAQNIKRLREKQKLSMDELSRLSGVSKSMLAQIERGDGNPTLSSLWKIANGMRVPFDALTARPKPDYQILCLAAASPSITWSWTRAAFGALTPTSWAPSNSSP